MTWDDGRKLPINPDTDFFRVLSPDECYEERSEKLQSAFIDSVNLHTHCCRCRHASGTVAEYAESAHQAGIKILGFSDHMPFPDFEHL